MAVTIFYLFRVIADFLRGQKHQRVTLNNGTGVDNEKRDTSVITQQIAERMVGSNKDGVIAGGSTIDNGQISAFRDLISARQQFARLLLMDLVDIAQTLQLLCSQQGRIKTVHAINFEELSNVEGIVLAHTIRYREAIEAGDDLPLLSEVDNEQRLEYYRIIRNNKFWALLFVFRNMGQTLCNYSYYSLLSGVDESAEHALKCGRKIPKTFTVNPSALETLAVTFSRTFKSSSLDIGSIVLPATLVAASEVSHNVVGGLLIVVHTHGGEHDKDDGDNFSSASVVEVLGNSVNAERLLASHGVIVVTSRTNLDEEVRAQISGRLRCVDTVESVRL